MTGFYSDDFYVVQHYREPELNVDVFRLRISVLVERPREYSLQDLMSLPAIERDIAFECGGNRDQIYNGLVGNARWRA